MRRRFWAAGAALALPLLLWAYNNGPDPGHAGVPGEQSCNRSMCHNSFPLNPSGGSVSISASGGDNYVPGTAQTITVTINDAGTVYGFQAAVRTSASSQTQAGTLQVTQSGSTFIYCSSADFLNFGEKSGTCPSNRPLEYVQHSRTSNSNTFTFGWTPPTSPVGDVVIYVATNSGNGNGMPSGDRIFTATKTLTPAAAGVRPTITAGGVISAFGFGGKPTAAAGGWLEIYGTNLSTTSRSWAAGDFSGSNAPTSLDGVSVEIGGKPAFVSFIGPTQVNVQVPDVPAGPTTLSVKNAAGTSDNYTLQVADRSPGILAPPSFKVGDKQYVAAVHPDTTASSLIFYGAPGLISGVTFRGLAPGGIFTLYGISFGATQPSVAPGTITGVSNTLSNVSFQISGNGVSNQNLETRFAGLSSGAVGLYQFNVAVPDVPDGEYTLTGSVSGAAIQSGLLLSIKKP